MIQKTAFEELEQVLYRFPKYHMKIVLGDFNAKVEKENIFKPTIGNESLHQDSADNGVGIINLATSNNLVLKGTMFRQRDFHKCTGPLLMGRFTIILITY